MNNKALYDQVSFEASKNVAQRYSTSFSTGIRLLAKELRDPVYAVYGMVRLADEIVDTFHDFDKKSLLAQFRAETFQAIHTGISLNPVLNSFARTVNQYGIEHQLIDCFFNSMEMDLCDKSHDRDSYDTYILGSAEVVGLMCLHIFCKGDKQLYAELKPYAMKLGAAFQKVNFLRDLKADHVDLGRTYFPGVEIRNLDEKTKKQIEAEIAEDFRMGFTGIRKLPKESRFGVYVAYVYYYKLFRKICKTPPSRILQTRIRIPNQQKFSLLFSSYLKHSFNLL